MKPALSRSAASSLRQSRVELSSSGRNGNQAHESDETVPSSSLLAWPQRVWRAVLVHAAVDIHIGCES